MDRYVYIATLPVQLEAQKDAQKTVVQVNGGRIAEWSFVENFLRFSNQEKIVFPRAPRTPYGDLRDTQILKDNDERIRFVNLAEFFTQSSDKDLLLLSTSWALDYLLTLRAGSSNQFSPAVSLIHAICSPSIVHHFLTLILSKVSEFDALVSPSDAGRKTLEGMWEHTHAALVRYGLSIDTAPKIPVIPLGVGEEFFRTHSKPSRDTVKVLYFGRFSLSTKADLFALIIAWQRVVRACPNALLVISGDDTQQRLAQKLLSVATELECSESVSVVPDPSAADKLALYAEADIFVSPSDSLQETFGLTILEAMASGLPVVASDWSGYREIVVNSRTGFLVPTIFPSLGLSDGSSDAFLSDIPAASTVLDLNEFAEKICLLIQREDIRRTMGENGRRRARDYYSWQHIIGQHDNLHNELRARAQVAKEHRKYPQGNSRGFLDVAPSDFFEHFATTTMGRKVKVRRVSDVPTATLRVRASLAAQNYHGVARLKSVLAAIPGNDWQVIEGVLARLKAEEHSSAMRPSEVLRHLGRLAKYAVIEVS